MMSSPAQANLQTTPSQATQATTATDRRTARAVSAILAAAISGIVGGGLIGLLLSAVAAVDEPSAIAALAAFFAIIFGAGTGGVLALVPGMAVALCLQRFERTNLAPIAGAAVGAVLALVGYRVLSLGAVATIDDKLVAYIGFAAAGMIGGLVGGFFLKRR